MVLQLLFGIIYGAFSLTLPILSETLIANLAVLGLIFALPELIGMAIDIPIGEFAHRFGRRRVIFYSGILLGLSAVFFILTRHPLLFVTALIFYELATQSFIVSADAEQVALTPNIRAGRFNGILEGMHNLGFSIGPVIAGALMAQRLEYPFLIALVIVLVMVLISAAFLPYEKHRENFPRAVKDVVLHDKFVRAGLKEFLSLGFEGSFVALIFFVFALHWGFIALLEPLYTKALGLSGLSIGLIYAGFTLPIFFVSVMAGKYIDRHGAKGVTVGGLILLALSSFGFAFTDDPRLLFIFALVSGVGDALLLPAVMTMLDKLSSYHTKEHISGVKVFAESSGYFAGPLTGGVFAAFFGYAATFFGIGFFLLGLAVAVAMVSLRVAQPTLLRR